MKFPTEIKRRKSKEAPKVVRRGRCNKCGMCCLISKRCYEGGKIEEGEKLEGYKVARKIGKKKFWFAWRPCKYLNFDMTCKIHKTKPEMCRDFPPKNFESDFFKIVKSFCSYRYVKVKKHEKVSKLRKKINRHGNKKAL